METFTMSCMQHELLDQPVSEKKNCFVSDTIKNIENQQSAGDGYMAACPTVLQAMLVFPAISKRHLK